MRHEELVTLLKEKGLSVSHQRLAILDYLAKHHDHPTVEMIYTGLKADGHPTLSRATVYNNIKTFVNAGLIHELKIGDHERRYDFETQEHSHFYCRNCGTILNLDIPEELQNELIENFKCSAPGCLVERQIVNFAGLCPDCREHLEQEDAEHQHPTGGIN